MTIDDLDACTADVCDSMTGQVTHDDIHDPLLECCDMVSGTVTTIDDGNPCTDDVCNGDGSVDHFDNTDPCDDGIVCTETDLCAAGVCSGTPVGGCSGVFINELMYHPADDLELGEFLELYNAGTATVDVSDWFFDGIELVLPPGTSIPAGGYVVVTDDLAAFSTVYGFSADFEYTGQLNNGGETVSLFDGAAALVDQVAYDDVGLWPITPDGEGPSAERIAARGRLGSAQLGRLGCTHARGGRTVRCPRPSRPGSRRLIIRSHRRRGAL